MILKTHVNIHYTHLCKSIMFLGEFNHTQPQTKVRKGCQHVTFSYESNISTSVLLIDFCTAYRLLYCLWTSVLLIDFCTAYRLLYYLQTYVLLIDFCTAYRLLYCLQTSVLLIDFCTAYRLLYCLQTSVLLIDFQVSS